MAYEKVPRPSTVYHLTQKGNLDSILDDGVIRRFNDTECWFCESLDKMKAYMEQTVMCEGKPYRHRRWTALPLLQIQPGSIHPSQDCSHPAGKCLVSPDPGTAFKQFR